MPLFPQKPDKPVAVRRLTVSVTPSKNDKLRRPGIETPVGDVYAIGTDGKKTRLSTAGLATDPKVSGDGKTVAWIEGQVLSYEDKDLPLTAKGYPQFPTYFPKQLVVWRGGRILARFATEKLYTVSWKWVDTSQIATSSQGSHGPVYLERWDVNTGRRRERRMGFEEKLPAWTKDLPI
jgi:hypothetical protein